MLSLIGIGNYAKVVLVRKKSSGKLYAMKIMRKKKIDVDKDGKFLRSQALLEKEILVNIFHNKVKMSSSIYHKHSRYFPAQQKNLLCFVILSRRIVIWSSKKDHKIELRIVNLKFNKGLSFMPHRYF